MKIDAVLQTYFTECSELLEQMESHLLQLERGTVDDLAESLNAIFRAAHTIKGSAGLFGFDAIVNFTHVVESLLDQLREQRTQPDDALISLLFRCQDHITTLLHEAETEAPDRSASAALSLSMANELEHIMSTEGYHTDTDTKASASNTKTLVSDTKASKAEESGIFERLPSFDVANDHWHISLRFGQNVFRDGMDPLSFLRYLETLGKIVHIVTLDDRYPSLAEFDPESCYLGFEIRFNSDATKQAIEDVFEFVRHDSAIRILPPHSALSEYIELIEAMPVVERKLGEILLECGALTASELEEALTCQRQRREQQHEQPLGEIITETDDRLRPVLEAAVQKQGQVRESLAREQNSLRVDADKLDTLINLVGELVTAGAGTALQADNLGSSSMVESVSTLNALLEEVRDAALRLRMVPIGATFTRFQRVVRDMAKELGKDVDLIITGAETELDKSVVEKIGDPLMHLVRNAMDHGIESPQVRQQQGKPLKGRFSLNAYHDSGNIVIEVGDDGKGLDPELLHSKAIAKGLIDENAVLSRDELFNLIFEPGFSTASEISNLSGRGVGMDVVKRNITALRGRIEINSEPGKGTTIRILLPLTLAIIDGFLIGVGDDAFVVPLDMVKECVELTAVDLCAERHKPYLNLRGQVLPLIYLRQHFELSDTAPRRQNVVIVQAGGQCAGLVVDRLMGEFQTVIKPLGQLFARVSGLSGSTILGSGAVALILDVQGLIHTLIQGEQRQHVKQ